jgi:hypothetical protein
VRLRQGLCPAVFLALLLNPFASGCDSGDRDPAASRVGAPAVPEPCGVGVERESLRVAFGGDVILLGCGRARGGTVVKIYSFRDAGGPCIVIEGLPGGARACGRAPSERVPAVRAAIGGPVIVRRSPNAALELYGETAPRTRRVLLRYRLPNGQPGERPALLIRASDPAALRAAGIRQPFGYFIGAVPPHARRVSAVALGRDGQALGRLEFDRLARGMHPTVFIAAPSESAANRRCCSP